MSNSSSTDKLYQIALTMLPNVGSTVAKNLLAYCGSIPSIFSTPKSKLEKIPMVGPERAAKISSADVLKEAEKELKFVSDYNIEILFFSEEKYPVRLKHCNDSPILLYYKGNADLNTGKTLGIVGTRRCTEHGREITKKIVDDLSNQGVLIVSGLAYGIDIASHQAALDSGLPTVGVLGHGLNIIYPDQHKNTAKRMVENGGLLTEYKSTDAMHPSNFPNRNRIIAGICDALLVVESGVEGGSVLTANIASSYNRDVFAIPGKPSDKQSSGCNFLIKTHKATLVENAKDICTSLGWEPNINLKKVKPQKQLLLTLSEEEQSIYTLLQNSDELSIDMLTTSTGMNTSKLAATLLEMEMSNILVSLPGKRYKLI